MSSSAGMRGLHAGTGTPEGAPVSVGGLVLYSPVQGLWPATRWPLGSGLSGHPGSLVLTGPGAPALLRSAVRPGSSEIKMRPVAGKVKIWFLNNCVTIVLAVTLDG